MSPSKRPYLVPPKPPASPGRASPYPLDQKARDHQVIDDQGVPRRYLEKTLTPDERTAFEAHLVDCAECTDRVLLAGMFEVRTPAPPRKTGLTVRLKSWQLLAILLVSALLLLGIPSVSIGLWRVLFP